MQIVDSAFTIAKLTFVLFIASVIVGFGLHFGIMIGQFFINPSGIP